MAEVAVFWVYFKHLYTRVNGLGNRGARASTGRDWAAEIIAGNVTFCDIV
jgi:hypothetical protein